MVIDNKIVEKAFIEEQDTNMAMAMAMAMQLLKDKQVSIHNVSLRLFRY